MIIFFKQKQNFVLLFIIIKELSIPDILCSVMNLTSIAGREPLPQKKDFIVWMTFYTDLIR
jgi:hypothetical protein